MKQNVQIATAPAAPTALSPPIILGESQHLTAPFGRALFRIAIASTLAFLVFVTPPARGAVGDAEPRDWTARPPSEQSVTLSKLRTGTEHLRGSVEGMLRGLDEWEIAIRKAAEDNTDESFIAAKSKKQAFALLGQQDARKDADTADMFIVEATKVVKSAEHIQARLRVWTDEASRQVRLNGALGNRAASVLEEAKNRKQLRIDLEPVLRQLELAGTLEKIQRNAELDLTGVASDIAKAVASIKGEIGAITRERDALRQIAGLYAEGAKWAMRSAESRYDGLWISQTKDEMTNGRQQLESKRRMHINLIGQTEDGESAVLFRGPSDATPPARLGSADP